MFNAYIKSKTRRRFLDAKNRMRQKGGGGSIVDGPEAPFFQFAQSRRDCMDYGGQWLLFTGYRSLMSAIEEPGTPNLLPALKPRFEQQRVRLKEACDEARGHANKRVHVFTDYIGDMYALFVISLDRRSKQLSSEGIQFYHWWVAEAELSENARTVAEGLRFMQEFQNDF